MVIVIIIITVFKKNVNNLQQLPPNTKNLLSLSSTLKSATPVKEYGFDISPGGTILLVVVSSSYFILE